MKIYFSPASPYVRKCLVVAHELGLAGQIEKLPSNAHPVNRDRTIIADNPLGQVPTFFTDEGGVLYDSRVICEYLDVRVGGRLIPASGAARWTTLTLQSLGDGMLDAALLARYEDVARPEAIRWPEWRAAQLDKIERHSPTSTPIRTCSPAARTCALTIGCALWYLDLRFADLGWRERHAPTAGWYEGFRQRPSMAASWSL